MGQALSIVKKGKTAAKKIMHAKVLLEADVSEGNTKTDEEIGEMLYVDIATVRRIRTRLVEEGLEAALNRKVHSRGKPLKFDGEKEARLIALCCSQAQEGRQRWTMQLLADKVVQLNIVDKVATATVWKTLKKTKLNLGKKKSGVSRQK
jgi:transposase